LPIAAAKRPKAVLKGSKYELLLAKSLIFVLGGLSGLAAGPAPGFFYPACFFRRL
jgi:hypothetical protein